MNFSHIPDAECYFCKAKTLFDVAGRYDYVCFSCEKGYWSGGDEFEQLGLSVEVFEKDDKIGAFSLHITLMKELQVLRRVHLAAEHMKSAIDRAFEDIGEGSFIEIPAAEYDELEAALKQVTSLVEETEKEMEREMTEAEIKRKILPKEFFVEHRRTAYQPCEGCGSRHVGQDFKETCMSCGKHHRPDYYTEKKHAIIRYIVARAQGVK